MSGGVYAVSTEEMFALTDFLPRSVTKRLSLAIQMPAVGSAVEDLSGFQAGAVDRATLVTSRFVRNSRIRDDVRRRAAGKCEYCNENGFLLENGQRYVETHHIIALADEGEDTPTNVIALCPAHHREAHYGANAEKLEAAFIRRVSRRKPCATKRSLIKEDHYADKETRAGRSLPPRTPS